MNIELTPIAATLEENARLQAIPECAEYLQMTLDFFNSIGYRPPWIGYQARLDGEFVGSAAFKGAPVNGKVEIAYGTFERLRHRGIGAAICRALVELAQKTDPSVIITARTLPEKNFSTRILERNGFQFSGTVSDPEDGEVWEWVYKPRASSF